MNAGRLPLIRKREVMWCCPNAPYWNAMSPALKDRYFIPRWSHERLRRHLEMLRAFGFNAIETSAAGQLPRNAGVDRSVWEEKMLFIMRTARELGMEVTFFVWGACFYDDARRAYVTDLDWHDSTDRAFIEREYRQQARYAPHVDCVTTHWVDPGGPKPGCGQCSIETAIEMHNRLMAFFRDGNPAMGGVFSTWAMAWPGWPQWRGYAGVEGMAQSRTLDAASGIAVESSNYGSNGRSGGQVLSAPDFAAIRRSGRKAGIWCWYTADIEIQPSLHVHTELLQLYFRHLHDIAGDGLDWHSIDDCCHGLNMHNLFMAGRLMQDPAQDARTLLDEFARGLVGDHAAGAVVAGLDALEQARCRSNRYAARMTGTELAPPVANAGVAQDTLPEGWMRETAEAIRAALGRLGAISVSANQVSAWPVTMPAAVYVDELRAHLSAAGQMMEFLCAVRRLKERHVCGEVLGAEMDEAIDALPDVTPDPEHAIGLEIEACLTQKAALHRQFGLWLMQAERSDLVPFAGDIRQVGVPADNLPFVPVSASAGLCFFDVRAAFGAGAEGVVYIRGSMMLPRGGAGRLLYGADGPVKVWVNGQPVACEPHATNPARADEYVVPVTWLAGDNTVLFALQTNGGRAWGVMARAAFGTVSP